VDYTIWSAAGVSLHGVKELQQCITEKWEHLDEHVIDDAVKQWHKSASVLVLLQTVDILNKCCKCERLLLQMPSYIVT